MDAVFELRGPLTGQTIALGVNGRFKFINGVCRVVVNPEELQGLQQYLAHWQAELVEEGHESPRRDNQPNQHGIEAGRQAVHGAGNGNPEADQRPEGEDAARSGQPESVTGLTDQQTAAVMSALGRLDHTVEDHWTNTGYPKLEAVREFSGLQALTRAELMKVAAGIRRAV